MNHHRSCRYRGVLLVEMLVAIGLLGLFILVSGKLFSTTLRLTHASHTATGTVAAFESCVRALRSDVWSATEMMPLAGGGMRIVRGDGAVISWTTDADGALTRRGDDSHPEPERRWPALSKRLTMHPDAGGLIVRALDGEIYLISPVMLARAGAP